MTESATELSPRYALYYAPQGGELYELGRHWLARDVRAGEDMPPPGSHGPAMVLRMIREAMRPPVR